MKKKKALQLISESFNDRSDARGDRARRFQRPGVSSVDFLDEGPSPFEQYRPNRSFVSRNVNPFPPLVAPRNANDVRLAIQDELDCWGIDSDHSRDHAVFSRLAVDESIMRFHGDKSHWTPPDTTAKVPRVLSDAIEFLLDFFLQKMTGGGKRLTFCNTRDFVEARFGVHLPYAPYFKKNGSLELSSAYRRIPRIHDYIDPFIRFHHVEEDPRAVVTATWTKTSSEGAPYHIVEAVVIHQLIRGGHNCIRCKTFGSFELNSKYVTSFSDVICSVCGSVYAVWTASTTESILKRLSKGNCNKSRYFGDYYDEFRHLRRLSNMYAMFVSMEDTSYMPAYVVKINGVLPSLSGRSFNLENIKIFSKVLIQPVLGNHPWFSISMPEHLDFVSTSLVAIHKYFAGLVFHNGARAPNSQESDVHSNSSKSELRNP